jgi:two-component system, chemotaxis family, protein-glutamate methylesterase/glutaminase
MIDWLVVVGASMGGLHALSTVLGGLPAGIDAAVVVVQHRSPDSQPGALERTLGSHSGLPVREVEDKDPIERGNVYLAPPDYHLLIEGTSLALSLEERVQFSRPSIDVLFESAAEAFGNRVIGVLLTGANEDGAAGLARIRVRGGFTIVQDPVSAERRSMPDAAIALGAAQRVVPLEAIATLVTELCGTRRDGERGSVA